MMGGVLGMIEFDPSVLKSGETRVRREKILDVLTTALQSVDPAEAIRRCVRRDGDVLSVGERTYDLRRYERIHVIGGGKASSAMASAIEEIAGDRIAEGIVNVKYGYTANTDKIRLNEAGHPLPDENGLRGSQRMLELAQQAGPDDLVLCLISGGGSALMPLPVDGVSLSDLKAVTDALLRCGATINEINAIRKHLSQLKGGNLARAAHPAEIVSLILSDVVGNPLDVIASGPTVPDASTFADVLQIIEKYDLTDRLPTPVSERFRRGARGEIADTPKAGDDIFERAYNLIIASNGIAAEAAVRKAEQLGFHTLLLSTYVEGEAREVAKVFAAIGREIVASGRPVAPPACVIAGGETTVTVRGDGTGGRNQELALSAAMEIEGLENVTIVGLATDGTDGPTDATGAIADGNTVGRAREMGLSPLACLMRNDAYHFFDALGDLLITGPTNTNVNDLTFVFVF